MLSATQQTAVGHIIAVQEQRFRLVTDTGQGLLLTLAHHASVGENDLQGWQQAKTPVAVIYEGQPSLEAADHVGTSSCPYCAVGCAQLVYAKGNDVIQLTQRSTAACGLTGGPGMEMPPRTLAHSESVLPDLIPQAAELTTGTRIDAGRRYGFFTDTTLCLGCKACEVNPLWASGARLLPALFGASAVSTAAATTARQRGGSGGEYGGADTGPADRAATARRHVLCGDTPAHGS